MVKFTAKVALLVLCAAPALANIKNLEVMCGEYNIRIYPNAIFLNEEKMDNSSHQADTKKVITYTFEAYDEMMGKYLTRFILKVPSKSNAILLYQLQDTDGNLLSTVSWEECEKFRSFNGKAPEKLSNLEKLQAVSNPEISTTL